MRKPLKLVLELESNMKRIFIIIIILCFACDSEKAPDCFQTIGERQVRYYDSGPFIRIQMEDNFNLQLKQGDEYEVRVEAGGNLFSDISVEVLDNSLVLRNNNSCELLRDYEKVIAYVTAPDVAEIRNASVGDVRSDGVIAFTRLVLTSNTSGGIDNAKKSGDFYMNVDLERFRVNANGFSRFFIQGKVTEATLVFDDELPLFEGVGLLVNDLEVLQRSANIMKVNPINSIRGEIRGTGDIIAVNRPEIVEVDQYFTGRLIFED